MVVPWVLLLVVVVAAAGMIYWIKNRGNQRTLHLPKSMHKITTVFSTIFKLFITGNLQLHSQGTPKDKAKRSSKKHYLDVIPSKIKTIFSMESNIAYATTTTDATASTTKQETNNYSVYTEPKYYI